jgi:hypothetical protein
MPRKQMARRFEPRYGISEPMLEVEAGYVAREVEDYRVYSINDLREKLADWQVKLTTAESNLSFSIRRLSDQERLILRCMVARDIWHIAQLYQRYFQSDSPDGVTGNSTEIIEEYRNDEPVPVLPFQETLFEM